MVNSFDCSRIDYLKAIYPIILMDPVIINAKQSIFNVLDHHEGHILFFNCSDFDPTQSWTYPFASTTVMLIAFQGAGHRVIVCR